MRQYVSSSLPDGSGILEVDSNSFRHLHTVLRVRPGDMIDVRLPDSSVLQMTVAAVDGKRKKITLQKCGGQRQKAELGAASPSLSLPEIWLFMFLPKATKMELVVRQATECGVSRIVPVSGKFSQSGNVQAFRARQGGERLARIVTEARQQSGSAVSTEILSPLSVEAAARMWAEACGGKKDGLAIVLSERAEFTVPLHEALALPAEEGASFEGRKFAVAVGCEGGIAPEEIEVLRRGGFVPVHFATNILRCETAALYGVAALQTAVTEGGLWHLKR